MLATVDSSRINISVDGGSRQLDTFLSATSLKTGNQDASKKTRTRTKSVDEQDTLGYCSQTFLAIFNDIYNFKLNFSLIHLQPNILGVL